MIVGLFSACGGSKISNEKGAGTVQANTAASADKYAPKDGKTYEISCLSRGYAQVPEDSYIIKLYDEKFNVKLSHEFVDFNKWDELLNLKFASNDVPDVIYCRSTDRLAKYVSQNLLMEVPQDVIVKYAPNLNSVILRDAPTAYNVTKVNGKNYGIPFLDPSGQFRAPIVWRTDWLKNVGITKIPETLTEYEQAFTKFVNEDPDKNGKKDTYGISSSAMLPIFGAFGVIVDPMGFDYSGISFWKVKDGHLVYDAIQPEAKQALELLAKWYGMGIINPEFVTGENKGGYWAISDDFVNGKIGYTAHGLFYHWAYADPDNTGMNDGADIQQMKKIYPNGNFSTSYGNPPIGPDGKTRGINQAAIASGISYVFSQKLQNEPDKLGKILQMFNWSEESPENWLINYTGYEGIHYDWVQKGKNKIIQLKPEYGSDPAKKDAAGFAQLFFSYDLKNNAVASPQSVAWGTQYGLDKYGVQDALQVPLPSASKYQADLNKMVTEAYLQIITGKKHVDYFDTFVDNWKKAGGEQLMKEADEWLTSTK